MESAKQSQISANGPGRAIKPFAIIDQYLLEVQNVISERLCEHPQTAGIEKLISHILAQSGKMLRPALVLLSGMSCGKILDEHIKVAAIFEIIHEATLLHDDVIDDADKRRGQKSLNKLYGNASAVLLGDFLLSVVFSMTARLNNDIASQIAEAAGRTCRGELEQNLQKRNWNLSQQQYIEIIADKSAHIFKSCCSLGAKLSNADYNKIEMLGDYGLNLGIAFQIADDLLDIIGDEEKIGKTLGTDFVETKPTLPLIHLLANSDAKQKNKIIALVDNNELKELAKLLTENGSIEYAGQTVRQYVQEAVQSITSLPDSPARSALFETASLVASRTDK